MQTDLLSRPGMETVHRLSRIRPVSQRETRAIERLKSWDGRLSPESIAATSVHAFTLSFGQAIVGAAVSDQELVERYLNKSVVGILPYVSSPWRFQSRLLELWEEGDESWFASPQHPEGRAWDDVALESLTRALDSLERRFGEDQERWRWGRVHGVEFSHPFGESNRLFRRIFCRHVEAGGASESVFQSGYTPTEPFTGVWAPVYRMLADVGDASRSRWQACTGQSGQPGSRHFDDRIPDWLAGRTNPVLREEQDVREAGDARLLRLEPQ
jgi:penicillin amidase